MINIEQNPTREPVLLLTLRKQARNGELAPQGAQDRDRAYPATRFR